MMRVVIADALLLGFCHPAAEAANHPAAGRYREALVADGVPGAQFTVADVRAEHDRLIALGVRFTQDPADMGTVTTAVFDDTCGNLIQIIHQKEMPSDEQLV